MYLFQIRPFWLEMRVSKRKLQARFNTFFGTEKMKIVDRQEAINILMSITCEIQKKMLTRIKNESTYGMLLKLYFIFDEVHSIYLAEKEVQLTLVEQNIDNADIVETFINNRNIERDIIDTSNIWIENCILHQHDLDISTLDVKKEFVMGFDLLIDLYLYGFASRGISLLMLSKSIGEHNSYYGLEIIGGEDIPAEILKYHPYIYFNTAIVGNQNVLVDVPLTKDANETEFGKGFKLEHGVEFLLFLAAIKSFHDDQLRGDDKSLTVITKERFIDLVEHYTRPSINGEAFYNSFVLTKDDIQKH